MKINFEFYPPLHVMELVLLGKNEQVLAFIWFLAHAETSVVQKIE